MAEIFPLRIRATIELMLPETKRFLIRTYPRVHHMNRKARVFELSIDVLSRDKNWRFLSSLQLVLGKRDEFHCQSLMILRFERLHFLNLPFVTLVARMKR